MTIKDRVLSFLKKQGISKEDFYRTTGLSASNFKGVALNSELGGEKIVKILSIYRDLSADWLLSGEGSMLRSDADNKKSELPSVGCTPSATPISPTDESFIYKMYKEEKEEKEKLNDKLLQMAEELGSLKAKLSQYEPETEVLSKKTKGLGHAKSVSTEKPSSPNADNATSVTVP